MLIVKVAVGIIIVVPPLALVLLSTCSIMNVLMMITFLLVAIPAVLACVIHVYIDVHVDNPRGPDRRTGV
jgi:hypothetical protein